MLNRDRRCEGQVHSKREGDRECLRISQRELSVSGIGKRAVDRSSEPFRSPLIRPLVHWSVNTYIAHACAIASPFHPQTLSPVLRQLGNGMQIAVRCATHSYHMETAQ